VTCPPLIRADCSRWCAAGHPKRVPYLQQTTPGECRAVDLTVC